MPGPIIKRGVVTNNNEVSKVVYFDKEIVELPQPEGVVPNPDDLIPNEEFFVTTKISAIGIHDYKNIVVWKLSWKGYGEHEDTWEPYGSVQHIIHDIFDFNLSVRIHCRQRVEDGIANDAEEFWAQPGQLILNFDQQPTWLLGKTIVWSDNYIESPKRFKCDYCTKTYLQRNILKRHVSVKHPEQTLSAKLRRKIDFESVVSVPQSSPPLIASTSSSSSSIATSQNTVVVNQISKVIFPTQRRRENQFKCDICEKKFSRKDNLNSHIRNIHLEIGLTFCAHCDKTYRNKASYANHSCRLSNRKEQCPICEKVYFAKILKRHIKDVHEKRKANCIHCNKLISEGNLKRHIDYNCTMSASSVVLS